MATFTKNAWVNGETITAEGLNGGKGVNVLEIGPDDLDDGSIVFEIEIATGLSAIDFIKAFVSCPGVNGVDTSQVTRVESYDEYDYLAISNDDVTMFYYPETGILTTSEPSSDGGDNGGDDGGDVG